MAETEDIENFLEDEANKALKKPVEELFEWVSNKSVSAVLSALSGMDVSARDILRFKRQKGIKGMQGAVSSLDISKTLDANKWFLIDAIHKTKLDPAKTGSMAAMQALKNIQDIEEREADKDPAEAILSGLIDFIAADPSFTKAQKGKIAKEVEKLRTSLGR